MSYEGQGRQVPCYLCHSHHLLGALNYYLQAWLGTQGPLPWPKSPDAPAGSTNMLHDLPLKQAVNDCKLAQHSPCRLRPDHSDMTLPQACCTYACASAPQPWHESWPSAQASGAAPPALPAAAPPPENAPYPPGTQTRPPCPCSYTQGCVMRVFISRVLSAPCPRSLLVPTWGVTRIDLISHTRVNDRPPHHR